MSFSSTSVTSTPPLEGLDLEDLFDVDVDAISLGKNLVERVLTNHLAERRLRNLIDGDFDALDRTTDLVGVDHPVDAQPTRRR